MQYPRHIQFYAHGSNKHTPSLLSVFEPVQRIKGPPGTSVQLTLQGTCEQLKVMDGREVTLQPPLCSDFMPDVPPSPLSADGIRHLNGCPVLSLTTTTETSPRRALRSISPGNLSAITRKSKLYALTCRWVDHRSTVATNLAIITDWPADTDCREDCHADLCVT